MAKRATVGSPAPTIDPSASVRPAIKRDNEGCVSTQDAAQLLGVSSRTLTDWRSKGCSAIREGGRVNVAGVRQWREDQIKAESERDSAELIEAMGGLSLDVIEAQKAQVELRLLELKLAEKLGLVLPRAVYEHALSTVFADATSILRSIGSQLGPLVAIESSTGACTKMIDEKIDEVLALMTAEQALNLERTGANASELEDAGAD